MRKGLIASEREDGRQLYRPCLGRDEYVRAEIDGLTKKLYGGDRAQFLSALIT